MMDHLDNKFNPDEIEWRGSKQLCSLCGENYHKNEESDTHFCRCKWCSKKYWGKLGVNEND